MLSQCFCWKLQNHAKPIFVEGSKPGCHAVLRCMRGTLWHVNILHDVTKVVLCGRRYTFATFSEDALHFSWQAQHCIDVSCCHFLANRIVSAAQSGDKVQIPQQRWHFVTTCHENRRKPRTKRRFWGWFVRKHVGKGRFWSCKVWKVRKSRTKCSFWCPNMSRFQSLPFLLRRRAMGEAAKPFLVDGFKTGCNVVLRGRRSTLDVSCSLFFFWKSQCQGCVKRWHWTLCTLHFTPHTLHSTLCTLHPTLYTCHFTLHTPHFTLYTTHFTLHTLHFRPHTLHLPLYTPHFTLYTPHSNSTLYTLHPTLYTPHFKLSTLHTSHFTLSTLHFTLHTLHFTLYTFHFPLHTLHFTLFTLHSTLPTSHFASHFTLYIPHFTLYTPHRTLHTLHFAPYTSSLHSTLCTLHSTLYTLHFTLSTPHFTLYTLHSTLTFHTWHSTLCILHFTLHTLHSFSLVSWLRFRGFRYHTCEHSGSWVSSCFFFFCFHDFQTLECIAGFTIFRYRPPKKNQ